MVSVSEKIRWENTSLRTVRCARLRRYRSFQGSGSKAPVLRKILSARLVLPKMIGESFKEM
jgi:hypothetical protein